MTYNEFKEMAKAYDIDCFIEAFNEYAEIELNDSDLRVFSMWDLDDLLSGMSPTEIIDSVEDGFNTGRPFFIINQQTGRFYSATVWDVYEHVYDYVEDWDDFDNYLIAADNG